MTGYVRYNVRKMSNKKMLQPLRLQHFFFPYSFVFLRTSIDANITLGIVQIITKHRITNISFLTFQYIRRFQIIFFGFSNFHILLYPLLESISSAFLLLRNSAILHFIYHICHIHCGYSVGYQDNCFLLGRFFQ